MNTVEEREMRREYLAREISGEMLGPLADISFIRTLTKKILILITRLDGDHDTVGKYFNNLDELAPYCTPDEMVVLLDLRQQLLEERTEQFFYSIRWNIRRDFSIQPCIQRCHPLTICSS